jgi:hypothetical protein
MAARRKTQKPRRARRGCADSERGETFFQPGNAVEHVSVQTRSLGARNVICIVVDHEGRVRRNAKAGEQPLVDLQIRFAGAEIG